MNKVILYGEMGEIFGREHEFEVRNFGDVIKALSANFKNFRRYLAENPVGFHVSFDENPVNEMTELAEPVRRNTIFKIAPATFGAGGGWGRIFLGTALIAAGIGLTFVDPTGVTASKLVSVGATMLITMGASMVIGGVATLLSNPPQINQSERENTTRKQRFFNGPINTVAQGGSVPVGYGKMIVGSIVVSAGIKTVTNG